MTWTAWVLPGLLAGLFAWGATSVLLRTASGRSLNRRLATVLFLEGLWMSSSVFFLVRSPAVFMWIASVGVAAMAALPFQYLSFLGIALDTRLLAPFRRRAAFGMLTALSVTAAAALLLFPRVFLGDLYSPPWATWNFRFTAWGTRLSLIHGGASLFGLIASVVAFLRARPGTAARDRARWFALAFAVRDTVTASLFLSYPILRPIPFWGDFAYNQANAFANILYIGLLVYGVLHVQLFDLDLKLKFALRQSTVGLIIATAFFAGSELLEGVVPVQGTVLGLISAGVIVILLRPVQGFAEGLASRIMKGTRHRARARAAAGERGGPTGGTPMKTPTWPGRAALLAFLAVAASACGSADEAEAGAMESASGVRAFIGATIVDGTGGPAISDGVLLVGEDGRIAAAGPAAEVAVPEGAERLDLSGRFVIPGLINTHGHVGDTRGLESGQYSRANVLRQLGVYARYGVTTVLSLGGDGAEGVAVRDEQSSPTLDRARLFVAGAVVVGTTEDAVREMVDGNAALGVDFIKIRVDDNLGTTDKMPPEIFAAVIDRAHELGLPVAAHLFYLDDAKALLDAGVDLIAHSVRDRPVDDELANQLIERDVCYTPTLAREVTTFVYEDVPDFFEDPFFLAEADSGVIEQLRDPERQGRVRDSPSAQQYKQALVQAQANVKTLSDAGVTIAMGTDTGPPGRFQGFYEHIELALMAEAGLTPAEILVSATGDAARCIGRDDIGTLEPGKWADFVVLGADPLADVANLREIESVWIAGNQVPGRETPPAPVVTDTP